MFNDPRINIILIFIVILVLIYFFTSKTGVKAIPNDVPELFTTDYEQQYRRNLDQYYVPASDAVKDKAIDTMICHPDCCNKQWPVPFDGLTADQIQRSIATSALSAKRSIADTSYTCSGGPNGAGCPCIPKNKTLANLIANRGQLVDDYN